MLGETIRKLRKEKGLTLVAFSSMTDLSPGYLSQVERGIAEPSLSSLERIAGALDIPAMLLLDTKPSEPFLFLPVSKQPVVSVPESGTVQYRLCSKLPSSEYMPATMLLEFLIQPFEQDFPAPISHNCEELIVVTTGRIEVLFLGESVRMDPGDTLILQKNVPHIIRNLTGETARGYSIMTPAIWSLKS